MARIKGGLNARKKHNRVLKLAKGYRGARSKQYRIAKQSVMRALTSAYAGRKLDQAEQYAKLAEIARKVTEAGGRLLLPVPANGRGIDMFVYLSRFGLPLFVEAGIVKNAAALAEKKDWIKPFDLPAEGQYTAVDASNRAETLQKEDPGIFLFGDGMMTSAVSAEYFAAARDDARSKVIITGHSAKGTLANLLLKEEYRRENDIRLSAEMLTIKVHNDEEDVLRIAEKVRPKYVMLFHSKASSCTQLIEKLTGRGIRRVCAVRQPLAI